MQNKMKSHFKSITFTKIRELNGTHTGEGRDNSGTVTHVAEWQSGAAILEAPSLTVLSKTKYLYAWDSALDSC